MLWHQYLATIGLIFNIGGVGLLFIYGPPQPTLEEGVAIVVEKATVLSNGRKAAEHDRHVRQTRIHTRSCVLACNEYYCRWICLSTVGNLELRNTGKAKHPS